MLIYQDKILLFGGIHDIAHEKNDILFFRCAEEKWSKIEEDSTKRPEEQPNSGLNRHNRVKNTIIREVSEPKFLANSQEKLHNKSVFNTNFFLKTSKISRNPEKASISPRRSIFFNKSLGNPNNMRNLKELKEERIRKEKNMKKMMLLSEFEVTESQRKELVVHSPTTEAMKNSINTLKIEMKVFGNTKGFGDKIEKNNETERNKGKNKGNILNLNPNEKKVNLIKGKKPCARDGCSANVYKEKVVIFGGDRHLMTFHDMFFLNLKLAFEESF